jgi:hypothetical protein
MVTGATVCRWLQLIKGSLTVITNLQHASPAMRSYSTSASEAALDACQIFLRLLQVTFPQAHLRTTDVHPLCLFGDIACSLRDA